MRFGKLQGGCLVLLLITLALGKAAAATVFSAVDGNVNFLFGDLQGGSLAIFDDSNQSYLGSSFLDVPVPSVVGITGPLGNGDFIATNELSETLILTGSGQFILGLFYNGLWHAETNVVSQGANSYSVFFANGGSVLEVDVQIVPAAVPVPAAVWLFGSGLLFIAGMIRRRPGRFSGQGALVS